MATEGLPSSGSTSPASPRRPRSTRGRPIAARSPARRPASQADVRAAPSAVRQRRLGERCVEAELGAQDFPELRAQADTSDRDRAHRRPRWRAHRTTRRRSSSVSAPARRGPLLATIGLATASGTTLGSLTRPRLIRRNSTVRSASTACRPEVSSTSSSCRSPIRSDADLRDPDVGAVPVGDDHGTRAGAERGADLLLDPHRGRDGRPRDVDTDGAELGVDSPGQRIVGDGGEERHPRRTVGHVGQIGAPGTSGPARAAAAAASRAKATAA